MAASLEDRREEARWHFAMRAAQVKRDDERKCAAHYTPHNEDRPECRKYIKPLGQTIVEDMGALASIISR